MELANTAKGVYQKAKDDKKFLDIYEQAKQLRNTIRTHIRNNYPEDYKKAIFEEDVDECLCLVEQVLIKHLMLLEKPKNKKNLKLNALQQPGVINSGPKASEDGVRDNAYVKQFKYKLVPKNKMVLMYKRDQDLK